MREPPHPNLLPTPDLDTIPIRDIYNDREEQFAVERRLIRQHRHGYTPVHELDTYHADDYDSGSDSDSEEPPYGVPGYYESFEWDDTED
jgi:hypothetical protein